MPSSQPKVTTSGKVVSVGNALFAPASAPAGATATTAPAPAPESAAPALGAQAGAASIRTRITTPNGLFSIPPATDTPCSGPQQLKESGRDKNGMLLGPMQCMSNSSDRRVYSIDRLIAAYALELEDLTGCSASAVLKAIDEHNFDATQYKLKPSLMQGCN